MRQNPETGRAMSETPRTYDRPRGAFSRGEGFTRPGGIRLRYIAIVLAVFFVYAFWVTRDWYPMEQFIPVDQRLHISIPNIINNRAQAAASPVWAALPDGLGASWVPGFLARDLGHPDWVLQNLIRKQIVEELDITHFAAISLCFEHSKVGRASALR